MKLTNEEKCTYCREYGNIPCDECNKKLEAKKAMNKTKFTKVAVSERLPRRGGFYHVFVTETVKDICPFNKGEFKPTDTLTGHGVEYYLEESPDREDEMIEMLEGIRNDIRTFEKEANQVAENFENSEMINSAMCSKAMARAYNTCNTKIESLLQSLKQEK